jgi:hypothetical protein
MFRVATVLAVAAAVTAPATARGWTDAHVRGAHAHVEVRPDGTARVSMELLVRIHGGWLEGLEVAGLDPDFALDETKPPWAVSGEDPSVKFEPTARTDRDRLSLSFRGRGASPRRGTLRVGFVYATSLAHRATAGRGDGTIRVRWTLPPWRSGLDGVSIAVTVPRGSVPASEDTRSSLGVERWDLGDRTLLVWQRSHLPRTVPWTVEVDVPDSAMASALRTPAAPPRPKLRSTARAPAEPVLAGPIVLAVALCVLVLLGRASFAHACRVAAAEPRPLVPLPFWLLAPVVIGACGWAALHWIERPPLALAALAAVALLSLQRTPAHLSHAPRLGRFRPAVRRDLSCARRAEWARLLGLVTPVDVTTPIGLGLAAAAATGIWRAAELGALPPLFVEATALLALPMITATRAHLPTTPPIRLARLARLARRWRLELGDGPAHALALVVHADASDRWQDARLRIVPERAPDDLRRLDVALADRRDVGAHGAVPVLIAAARPASAAALALSRTLGADTLPVVRELSESPAHDVRGVLDALAADPLNRRAVDSEAA